MALAAASLQAQGARRPDVDQRPIFRAATRLIEVTVVVHDSAHHPVPGLTRNDFTLYDEGKEQTIELFSVQSDPSAIARHRARSNDPDAADSIGPERVPPTSTRCCRGRS